MEHSMISDEKLTLLGKKGFLPGPEEKEEEFLLRVSAFSSSRTFLPEKVKKIFGIEPDWIELEHSAKGLLPWEGGALFIDDDKVSLRVRKKNFIFSAHDEMVSHELVHLVRMKYEEPFFEEMLAYQTSDSYLRRNFGPLFQSSGESLFFVGILFALSILNFFFPFMIFGFPLLLVPFLWRLREKRQIFSACLKKVEKINRKKALGLMLRLTDQEIKNFSKWSEQEIENYLKKDSLRFREIRVFFYR